MGSHESLPDHKGLYYAMWRNQIGESKNAVSYTHLDVYKRQVQLDRISDQPDHYVVGGQVSALLLK